MSAWWALIGPVAGAEPAGYLTTPHDAFRVLREPTSIGPLELQPGEKQLIEYFPRLDLGWVEAVYWPIMVSRGSSDEGAAPDLRAAARQVHRLCCLLSLGWTEPWQVRVAPRLTSHGPAHVPDSILIPSSNYPGGNPQVGQQVAEDLPEWFSPAWIRLDDAKFGSKFVPCLSIWHEGIMLQAEHPSLSFMAYVASIEQASHLLFPGRKFERDSERFWAAVEIVVSPEALGQIKEINPYGKRSATVHGGGLHGIESEFGHMLLPPIGKGDPIHNFVFDHLRQMARASRDVLLRTLQQP